VKNFGVCDFSRLAVTDWRLRRWRLWFLALSNAPPYFKNNRTEFFQIIDLTFIAYKFPFLFLQCRVNATSVSVDFLAHPL